MNYFPFIFLLSFVLGLQACGSGGGSISDDSGGNINETDGVTVSFSISDTSTGVAPNVVITATFSGSITEPAVWSDVLTLKKDGLGDSLCTGYTYDSSTRMAECTYDDDLDGDSSYTVSNSGLSGVADATVTFTTGSEIAVTMTKTSVTSDGGDVTLTFNLASAVPSGWTLDVSATDADGTELSVSGCAFNDSRTSCSCTVSGIGDCTTFLDYTAHFKGTGGFEWTFNSADDEFESDETLTNNCWVQTGTGATLSITADQTLRMVVPSTVAIALDKSFSGVGDIAVLTAISSVDRPTTAGDEDALISTGLLRNDSDTRRLIFNVSNYAGVDKWTLTFATGSGSYGAEPVGGGSLAGTSSGDGPFFACMVRSDDTVKTYLSTDGVSYTQLSSDNMNCYECAIGIDAIVEASTDWATVSRLRGHNEVPNATLSGEYDYIRFKTTSITGESSADCPPL